MTETKTCPHCGSNLVIDRRPHSQLGTHLGVFEAFRCTLCSRIYYTPDASRRMDVAAVEKGVWGTDAA